MKYGTIVVALAVATVAGQPVSAQQSLRDFENAGQSDLRASVSISIPLGGPKRNVESEPRIDFAMQSQRLQPETPRFQIAVDPVTVNSIAVRRTALSLTLERNPQMLVNGQQVATFGPRLNADEEEAESGGEGGDTALYVIGGLVLVGGAMAIVVTDTRDALSDAIGPAD